LFELITFSSLFLFPVLVAGTSGKDTKFHPLAIAVNSTETAVDFAFIFQALKENCNNLYSKVLVPDGADAVGNRF